MPATPASSSRGGREPEELTLKADPAAQRALLDLQRIDSTLDQLEHRLESLPEHATLTALAARRTELSDRQGRLEVDLSDFAREQRKADADVEQVKSRRQRNADRIDQGLVGDPKQLQALQHEMGALEARIGDLEDVELGVMERIEAAQGELAEVNAELESLARDIVGYEAIRDAASAEINASRASAQTERNAVAATLPVDLTALYLRLRAQLGGTGAGALQNARCGGCRLDIGPAELSRFKAAPPDEVLRCEECNRILVRVDSAET